jgi:hypothetical protein
MFHYHVPEVISPSLFIDHRYVVEVHLGPVMLKHGHQLDLEEFGCGRVVLLVHREVRLMKGPNVVDRQHEIPLIGILESILVEEIKR